MGRTCAVHLILLALLRSLPLADDTGSFTSLRARATLNSLGSTRSALGAPSLMRERSRARCRVAARLGEADKELLAKLSELSLKGDWDAVEAAFNGYNGTATPVFSKVLHTAFLCARYQAGVEIYKTMSQLRVEKTLPIYTLAIKLFAQTRNPKLGRLLRHFVSYRVQEDHP